MVTPPLLVPVASPHDTWRSTLDAASPEYLDTVLHWGRQAHSNTIHHRLKVPILGLFSWKARALSHLYFRVITSS